MAWSVVPSGFFLGYQATHFPLRAPQQGVAKGHVCCFLPWIFKPLELLFNTHPPAACGNPWRTHLAYRLALCGSQGAFFAVAANQRGLGRSFLQLASPEDAMSSQGLWLCEAFLSVLVFWCYLASGPCCFVDLLKRVVVITGWITTGSLHW